MKTNATKHGITRFQMEMENFLYTRVHNVLDWMYGEIEYHWGEFSVRIDVTDGVYKGIVINIHPSNYEVYKVERKRGDDRIYYWFGGSIKTIKGERYCDTRKEYDLLMFEVIQPIQKVVDRLESNNLTRKYVDEQEVRRVTGATMKEHDKLVRAVTKMADGIGSECGFGVSVKEIDYYSYTHYTTGTTVRLDVYEEDVTTKMAFSAGGNRVEINTDNINKPRGNRIVQEVAGQVIKTRGFTKYNQNRLREAITLGG